LLSIDERAMYYDVPLLESFDTMLLGSLSLFGENLRWIRNEHAKRSRERDIEPSGGASESVATNANLWLSYLRTFVVRIERVNRAKYPFR